MDVFEALQEFHKESSAVDNHTIRRRPLIPAEKNNGSNATTTTRRCRTREVSSRYKSPTPGPPSPVSNSRRCPSPSPSRNASAASSTPVAAKRAVSADRKRPSTPPSPSRPSTPVSDTSAADSLSGKKVTGGGSRLPEVLWPSTMRSLSVSFQSDSYSIPVKKEKEKEKERPISSRALSDRTLKQSSNVAAKQAETARKLTPERRSSPLKGKNLSIQTENSRPVDGARARLIDKNRWPSRTGGKLSPSMLTKSVDLSDNSKISSFSQLSSSGVPSLRRLSAEGIPRPLHKTSSDGSQLSEFEDHIGALGLRMKSVDDSLLRLSGLQKSNSVRSPEKAAVMAVPAVAKSLPGSRLPSPGRTGVSKATPSPVKTRPATPTRGASPSRIRASSPTRPTSGSASVLSFIADIKKGKKTNQLEDAHLLRLLYNRQLQWRFANAQADAALYIQKITAEETLYNVWETNLELWDSVVRKRIELQRLNLELKLHLVLKEQLAYLDDWALLESDHSTSLDGAIKDLEASTLRLPVTGGAKAGIDSLKVAMNSAIDVMQMMGSSIYYVLSKVEGMNGLVSELADLAGQERAMLNECDALLSSTSAMQVKEYSLRTQVLQSQQDVQKTRHPILWATT